VGDWEKGVPYDIIVYHPANPVKRIKIVNFVGVIEMESSYSISIG